MQKVSGDISHQSQTRRSRWRITILLSLLPVYALMGWLRFTQALRFWEYFLELNIWPRPLYFAISGALIGTAFTLDWLFLLLKQKSGSSLTRILGAVFLVWFWIDRILLSLREAFFNQLLVSMLITITTLAVMIFLPPRINSQNKEASHEPQTGTGS